MTFEKCVFPICTHTGKKKQAEEVFGYKFAVQLPTPSEFVYVGVYKRGSYNKMIKGMAAWVVTCLDTGYEICEGDTRKDAVSKFMTKVIHPYERFRGTPGSGNRKDFEAMKHDFDVLCGVAK